MDYAALVGLAKQAGFPEGEAQTAAAVALAESSGNPTASHRNSNGSTDFGLWQINSVHSQLLAGKVWQEPSVNARMAYEVWKGSGWNAWTTYKTGAFRRYANGANSPSGGAAPGATTGDPFSGLTASLDGIGNSFSQISAFANTINKIAMPQLWVRVMAGVFGAGLVGFGVVMLTREVKH